MNSSLAYSAALVNNNNNENDNIYNNNIYNNNKINRSSKNITYKNKNSSKIKKEMITDILNNSSDEEDNNNYNNNHNDNDNDNDITNNLGQFNSMNKESPTIDTKPSTQPENAKYPVQYTQPPTQYGNYVDNNINSKEPNYISNQNDYASLNNAYDNIPEQEKLSNNELLRKLDNILHLLEEQQEDKTNYITEELILYVFLGVFIIYVLDSFVRIGKYVR